MSEHWYSAQTANHLIWAVAVVLLAVIALAGLLAWTRHREAVLYAKLAAEENTRREREAALTQRSAPGA